MNANYNPVPSTIPCEEDYECPSNSCGCNDSFGEVENVHDLSATPKCSDTFSNRRIKTKYQSAEEQVCDSGYSLPKENILLDSHSKDSYQLKKCSITANPVSVIETLESCVSFTRTSTVITSSVGIDAAHHATITNVLDNETDNLMQGHSHQYCDLIAENQCTNYHIKESMQDTFEQNNTDYIDNQFQHIVPRPNSFHETPASTEEEFFISDLCSSEDRKFQRSMSLNVQSSKFVANNNIMINNLCLRRQNSVDAARKSSQLYNNNDIEKYHVSDEPNIQSNLLSNISLHDDSFGRKYKGGTCKEMTIGSSSPCITDINGQTSFKVSNTNCNSGILSKESNRSTFRFNLMKQPYCTNKKNNEKTVSNKLVEDKLTPANAIEGRSPLMRSKSLCESSQTNASQTRRVNRVVKKQESITRNNSTPDITNSKTPDESVISSFFNK